MTKDDKLEKAIKAVPKNAPINIKIPKKKEKKQMKNINISKIFNAIKDIVLIAMIAGLIGFISGIRYQEAKTADIKTQASEIAQLKESR